jgi:hypothetical protein
MCHSARRYTYGVSLLFRPKSSHRFVQPRPLLGRHHKPERRADANVSIAENALLGHAINPARNP